MTEPTKAEIMLDSVTKSNRLINYLRFCKEHPIPPLRLDLRPSTNMHRIRSGKDILCPACREPLKKTDVVAVTMWD